MASLPGPGILGLDRKAMEEARLARQANKRKVAEVITIDDESDQPASKAARPTITHSKATAVPTQPSSYPAKASTTTSSRTPKEGAIAPPDTPPAASTGIQYPRGVVKKTWVHGYPRIGTDIKVEEVLQKSTLKTAVISSFVWDFDWLTSKFNSGTKFIIVLQARNQRERDMYEKDFEGMKSARLCMPPMSGNNYGCMHSKLMLLFHATHLRVVVPSANFLPFDWGETGTMENSVFLVDLPRLLEQGHGEANDTQNAFSAELVKFLRAQDMYEDAVEGIMNFDFSATKGLSFVHTMAGSHTGQAAEETGFPLLRRQVEEMGLHTPTNQVLKVDMAASSIGALDTEQLHSLHRALRGIQPEAAISSAPPAMGKKRNAGGEEASTRSINNVLGAKAASPSATTTSMTTLDDFTILFPSYNTVTNSKGGADHGGTLFLQPQYYARETFPTETVHEYHSKREGCLSHNKLIFARSSTSAFVYLGSHNLSQSAWGKPSVPKSGKDKGVKKLTCANWECGVLVPAYREPAKSGDEFDPAAGEGKSTSPLVDEADISTASEDEMQDEQIDKPPTRAKKRTDNQQRDADGKEEVLPFSVLDSVIDVPFQWPPKKYGKGDKPWCATFG